MGHLAHGGSYVALTNGKGDLTVVIETMVCSALFAIDPLIVVSTYVLLGDLRAKLDGYKDTQRAHFMSLK